MFAESLVVWGTIEEGWVLGFRAEKGHHAVLGDTS